jgi:hypothetical protein
VVVAGRAQADRAGRPAALWTPPHAPQAPLNYDIAPGERAMFVGPPRHGKSNIIAWHLEPCRSFVVFDSKRHPDEWAKWAARHGWLVSEDPADISHHAKVVHQIDNRALTDRSGWSKPGRIGYRWTEALTRFIARGHTIGVFDETVQTLPAGAPHPQAARIFTQGAAFGSSAWCGTQIANRIETLIPRLSEHAFVFRLVGQEERARIASARAVNCDVLATLGGPNSEEDRRFEFAYHRMGDDAWTVCGAVDKVM